MAKGKAQSDSTQTTTTQLPGSQQTNIDALMKGAMDYYNTGGRTFYPDDLIANFDPLQTQGQNQIVNYATGAGQNFANEAMAGNRFAMDPNQILNPDAIPGFSGSVDALTRGYTKNLTENILPSIRGGATGSGQGR